MSNFSKRTVLFIEWDARFAKILKGVTLSPSLRGTVAVHIFYSQDNRENISVPPYKPWILTHPVPAVSKEGLWEMMETYTLRFNFRTSNYSSTQDQKHSRSHGNGASRSECSTDEHDGNYYVLSTSRARSEALARKVYDERGVRLDVITDVEGTDLLDFLNFKCDICKIAFNLKGELQRHIESAHGLTCLNVNCRYNDKKNAFSSETDFRKHLRSQLRCEFCPTKVFCDAWLLDNHMRSTHRQCGCGCGKYFVSRAVYLDHFFSTYPSPKDIASAVQRPTLPPEFDKSAGMPSRQKNEETNAENTSNFEESQPMYEQSGENFG